MKYCLALILILFVSVFSISAQSKIEGFWAGAIQKDGKTWRVNLDIKKQDENLRALIDFVDVDAEDLEFSIKQNGDVFRLERPQPNSKVIVFEGTVKVEIFS